MASRGMDAPEDMESIGMTLRRAIGLAKGRGQWR